MDSRIEVALKRARIALINEFPFFGELGLALRLVEAPDLPTKTLATDGKRLFYNPDWVASTPERFIMSGLAHETVHYALQHVSRRGDREPKRWNFAIDYVTNAALKEAGMPIMDTWLYDSKYKDMSAEEVYDKLESSFTLAGASGAPFDGHIDAVLTPEDVDEITQQIAAAVGRHPGNVPGQIRRAVKEATVPPADWRSVMSRFFTERSKNDFSMRRPSRRFVPHGHFLPGLYSENMGKLAFVIDTSGSITQEILDAFGGHTNEIVSQVTPTKVVVMYADADVNHVDEFDQYEPLRFEAHGGGGTDFCPAIEALEEEHAPVAAAYLTDGYGRFPNNPPSFPVLWLMTTDVQPPWGECVRIQV